MGTSSIASLFLRKLQKAKPKLLGTRLGSKRESEAGGVEAAARPAVTPAQEAGLQALTRPAAVQEAGETLPSRPRLPFSSGGDSGFKERAL